MVSPTTSATLPGPHATHISEAHPPFADLRRGSVSPDEVLPRPEEEVAEVVPPKRPGGHPVTVLRHRDASPLSRQEGAAIAAATGQIGQIAGRAAAALARPQWDAKTMAAAKICFHPQGVLSASDRQKIRQAVGALDDLLRQPLTLKLMEPHVVEAVGAEGLTRSREMTGPLRPGERCVRRFHDGKRLAVSPSYIARGKLRKPGDFSAVVQILLHELFHQAGGTDPKTRGEKPGAGQPDPSYFARTGKVRIAPVQRRETLVFSPASLGLFTSLLANSASAT